MSKRIISTIMTIVLVATLLCTSLLFVSCDKKGKGSSDSEIKMPDTIVQEFIEDPGTKLSIGILADVHVMSEDQAIDGANDAFMSLEARGQKMLGLSESILETAVDKIIAEGKLDVVISSGDNTDDGGELSHRAVAAQMQRLEDAGIKVFTIPGNHDLNNKSCTFANGVEKYTNPTTAVEFAEIYKNFGYDKNEIKEFYDDGLNASTITSVSNLSYVADIDDDFRLIAIDMCQYSDIKYLKDEDGKYAAAGYAIDQEGYVLVEGERLPVAQNRHDGAMTAELLDWVKAKIAETIADGKEPIGVMHFPLVQHFGPLVKAANSVVNDPDGRSVSDELADAGMRYMITGHIHIQDDALYTSNAGNKIYDINSASLCNYPTPVRYIHFTDDEAIVRTYNVPNIDSKYLPAYASNATIEAVTSNLYPYSLGYIDSSMLAKVKNKVDMDLIYKLLDKFGIEKNGTNDAAVDTLANGIYNDVFVKFLNMPLYKKTANGKLSVEEICDKYGISLPASQYTGLFNMAMSIAAGVYGGDEKADGNDPRATILKYSLFSAFYVIADYDLFGKLNALNPNVKKVDLMPAMSGLFKNGNLDVCGNDLLLSVISSLDINLLKKYFTVDSKTTSFDLLKTVKTLVKNVIPKDMLFGLDVNNYIIATNTKGSIKLGALLDENFYGKLTVGLLNDDFEGANIFTYGDGTIDSAVPDNNFVINRETFAYSTLK